MQKIPRNAYNIVLFKYDRYFTCLEVVNFVLKYGKAQL